jgi:alpha-1,3-mannosyltransferase
VCRAFLFLAQVHFANFLLSAIYSSIYFKLLSSNRMLSEETFLSKELSIGLLVCHISLMFLFLHLMSPYGLFGHIKNALVQLTGRKRIYPLTSSIHRPLTSIEAHHIVATLLGCNFIGICFSRSLHYQFYMWFFHSLPFILYQSNLSLSLK